MATKRAKRRAPNTLRVYLRKYTSGERWWWVAIPGDERRALDLRETEATEERAHRIACERYASGALTAGAPGTPTQATLEGIVETYLKEQGPHWKRRTLAGYKLLLAAFTEAMAERGVVYASEVTSEVFSAYLAARQRETENATINRTIAVLRPMAKWGRLRVPALLPSAVFLEGVRNLREIGRSAAPLIPSPAEWTGVVGELAKGVVRVAHPDAERYAAQARANARGIALFVAVAVQTGLRVDELRHLRPEDVGTDEVRVAAYEGWSPKGHRERVVPVPASTASHAREMVAWRTTARGLNGTMLALGEGWLNKRLDAAWKKLKAEGDAPRMHDARRTFATELSRAGQPMTLIRDRMGHKDVQTTERYLGRYRTDRERAVPDLGIGAALGHR